MSFFSFNRGGGSSNAWNYSDNTKENYSTTLMGTVVELSDPLKTKFNSQEIDRWQDGNPKRNICVTILQENGQELNWIFNPGSSRNPSQAMMACQNALIQAGINASGLEDLGGLTIGVATQEPPQGFKYGQGAPRPWTVQISGLQKSNLWRGTKHIVDPVTEKQAQPQQAQPAQQAQPQMQPMQQQPVMQAQPTQVQVAAVNAAQAAGMQQQVPQSLQQAQDAYADSDIPF